MSMGGSGQPGAAFTEWALNEMYIVGWALEGTLGRSQKQILIPNIYRICSTFQELTYALALLSLEHLVT